MPWTRSKRSRRLASTTYRATYKPSIGQIHIFLMWLLLFPQTVRPIAQAGNKNLELSPLTLFAFFVNRCKENLHIVVAFSPIGDAFRNRLRQFPSLINCCTIDWFQVLCLYWEVWISQETSLCSLSHYLLSQPWPEEALERVANSFLLALDMTESERQDVIPICKTFHTSANTLSQRYDILNLYI